MRAGPRRPRTVLLSADRTGRDTVARSPMASVPPGPMNGERAGELACELAGELAAELAGELAAELAAELVASQPWGRARGGTAGVAARRRQAAGRGPPSSDRDTRGGPNGPVTTWPEGRHHGERPRTPVPLRLKRASRAPGPVWRGIALRNRVTSASVDIWQAWADRRQGRHTRPRTTTVECTALSQNRTSECGKLVQN